MTKDDIIRMVLEVRDPEKVDPRQGGFWVLTLQELERFAHLVAAHKAEVAIAEAYRCGYKDGMEAAAVICENLAMQQDLDVRDECAAAIRARGNT
jgi:hypothetical protein